MSVESDSRRNIDSLIMEELRGLRSDVREDINVLRKDIKGIHLRCGVQSENCNKKYVTLTTFWRMIVLGSVILVGSYTFSGSILAYVMKHVSGV